jgi:hypothetical protein
MPILVLLLPVDAVDMLEEAVDEMDAELLAVGRDVDAGVFLLLGGLARAVCRSPGGFGESRRTGISPSGVPWTTEVVFAASVLATHPWVAVL